jgi:hypothetical protein
VVATSETGWDECVVAPSTSRIAFGQRVVRGTYAGGAGETALLSYFLRESIQRATTPDTKASV